MSTITSFRPDEGQIELVNALHEVLAARCTTDVVRKAWLDPRSAITELWEVLGSLGALGALVPEPDGLGGSDLDLVFLLEECGRFLVPGPVVEHVAIAIPLLLKQSEGSRFDASALIAGASVVTVTEAGASATRWAAESDYVIGFGADSWTMSRSIADELNGLPAGVDASITWGSVPDTADVVAGGEIADLQLIVARGTLGVAAQLLGMTRRMLDTTVQYVGERRQFGTAVGSQQAVKHMLADVRIALEFARPAVYRAAQALANGEPTAVRDVAHARVSAAKAAALAARHSLQCHGAIGYTWEFPLHLAIKRELGLRSAWGSERSARRSLANNILGVRP
jgi:alkylation response protein AidB-like acyl-CoA dehydrogenase